MPRRFPSATQLILVVILAGLVAALVIVGRHGPPATGRKLGTKPTFDPASVDELLLKRGPATTRIVREADGYWIVEPYRDRVDEQFLAQSLRVASTLAPLRSLPDTASAPFGLDPPNALWTCRWSGGTYGIALGDSLPAGGGRFARRSGSPSVIILDSFLARRYLAPPSISLHQPVAAPLAVGPIDSVRIETREEHLVLVRHRADYWEFVSPVRVEGSAAQLSRAVEALRTDGLTAYLGPTSQCDLRALGLDPPRAIWTLIQGTRRQTVRIGHPSADQRSVHVIPAGREVVALIGSENFRQWVDGVSRLRENLLFWTPADSISSVDLSDHDRHRRFLRKGGGAWREIAAAETLAVRTGAFNLSLENLCSLRAIEFANQGSARGFEEQIRLLLGRESGVVDTAKIAAARGQVCEMRAPRQAGVCMVPAEVQRTWSLWLDRPLRP